MDRIATGDEPGGAPETQPAPACTLVIFGAGGDLAARLLVPALYNLERSGVLADGFTLLGVDLAIEGADQWKAHLREIVQDCVDDPDAEFHPHEIDADAWGRLMDRADYLQADFTDPATFETLAGRIDGAAIFYLAVQARFFCPITEALGAVGLLEENEDAFRRLVVEKPFGSDLASAQALNARLLDVARDEQIFRIDHFMGKEPVQSILAMRFANRIFEPIWRAEHIAEVEITASETLGVEERGRFYEATGALRDMVPNHLFQLLCMVAMEPPTSLDAEAVRSEKSRLLRCVRSLRPEDVVFGQYEAGRIGERDVPGYHEEEDVAPDSETETFVALRLAVENWRWSGTRFVLRTGKRLNERRTQVAIRFRAAPFDLFARTDPEGQTLDEIVLEIAPEHGVDIAFDVKRPGYATVPARTRSRSAFDETFGERAYVGYEALLHDCMVGNPALFPRYDMIEEAWRIVDPVLAGDTRPDVLPYPAGSDGPDAAAKLNADR
ncbi:glucose-6-phosphate dehydrogenase [uncultured Jannaschia sp.]|uniref:glucose-6-phosphate dehydrogenase n=1 Tax=uncultured Jannaschia sp. TaxID=293347 RepID=UPI002605B836|nr:glucose-6-phosphate dehydrogenase [uncultured Jannaschia sp.]